MQPISIKFSTSSECRQDIQTLVNQLTHLCPHRFRPHRVRVEIQQIALGTNLLVYRVLFQKYNTSVDTLSNQIMHANI